MSTDYRTTPSVDFHRLLRTLPPEWIVLRIDEPEWPDRGGREARIKHEDGAVLWVYEVKDSVRIVRFGAHEVGPLMPGLAEHFGVVITDTSGLERYEPAA